eukprot:jgi/Tetstr1/456860/TSEL_043532.t1
MAWGRLRAATVGHLNDDVDARMMAEREVEAAPGLQKELAAFLDKANSSRLRNEVGTLLVTCMEQILLFGQLNAASSMWTVAIQPHCEVDHDSAEDDRDRRVLFFA